VDVKQPILILFCLLQILIGQTRTALSIQCDTHNIPIYIDDRLVGYTPFKHEIDVIPGWHRVSFFPEVEDGNLDTRALSRDIRMMGTQDVMVEPGEVVHLALSYKSLGGDIDDYYKSIRTGELFGFSMVIILLSIVVWAYG